MVIEVELFVLELVLEEVEIKLEGEVKFEENYVEEK